MNITLAAVHQITFSEAVPLHNSLGVLQLAACLRRRNIKGVRCRIPDLGEFHHLYNRDFEETMDRVMETMAAPAPDVLGLSTMSNNLPMAVEICERVKKRYPRAITVLGGQGASFCAPEILSAFPRVDAVIRGEADVAFPDYIEALTANVTNPPVKGLVYRGDRGIVDNGWPDPIANLDELPLPAFDLCGGFAGDETDTVDRFGDYNGISLEVGRGCSFNCSFCSTCLYFKREHRLKSVERVMEEIMETRKRFGGRRIIFKHDILIYQHDYIDALCRAIRRRLPGLTWKCHARFDTIDRNILEKIRDAGCNEIFLGVEAATPRMLEAMNKQLDLAAFDETVKALNDLEFRFSLSFILGYPGEEPADVEALFDMALRVRAQSGERVAIKIHTLVPLAGSALYEEWKDKLAYDRYGSHSTSDMPRGWRKLRETIKRHPTIFPLFFHIPIGGTRRTRSIKFELLGWAVDSLMKHSFLLAYLVLGKRLPAALVRGIDKIELPPPSAFKGTRYTVLTRSIRRLLLDLLGPDPVLAEKYDVLARFEIAVRDVFKQEGKGYVKVFETYYDPGDLMNEIKTGTISGGEENRHDEKLFFMISRDAEGSEGREGSKVKCVQIPRQLAEFNRS